MKKILASSSILLLNMLAFPS